MFHHDFCNSGDFSHDTPGQIYGFVKDVSTGLPIEGATVQIDSEACITNASGFYSIHLCCGAYSINVTREGYQSTVIESTVLAGLLPATNITLSPSSTNSTDTNTGTRTSSTGGGLSPIYLGLGAIVAGSAIVAVAVIHQARRKGSASSR